jgi:hypothetical protein
MGITKKRLVRRFFALFMAERAGFEPAVTSNKHHGSRHF